SQKFDLLAHVRLESRVPAIGHCVDQRQASCRERLTNTRFPADTQRIRLHEQTESSRTIAVEIFDQPFSLFAKRSAHIECVSIVGRPSRRLTAGKRCKGDD